MELESWCDTDTKINNRHAWNRSHGVQKLLNSYSLNCSHGGPHDPKTISVRGRHRAKSLRDPPSLHGLGISNLIPEGFRSTPPGSDP